MGSKDFPFKGFIKCYSCGSSLVGEQKLRQRQDGTIREHIYYHCSRQVDRDCKELFAKEADIIDQLYEMRHKLMPDQSIFDQGLRTAIEKVSSISDTSFEKAFMFT